MTAVAGIDPSLAATGLALPDGRTLLYETASGGDLHDRTILIVDWLLQTLERGVELVVIEALGGGGPGRKSMIAGVTLGGSIRLEFRRRSIDWLDVAPNTLKAYATGSGSSKVDKAAMRQALAERLLGTDALPAGRVSLEVGHDEIDALWLRDVGRWVSGDPAAGPHEATKQGIVASLRAAGQNARP